MIPAAQPGSVALVTGASSGIGLEAARQLAQRGHDLVICARRRERLEELAAELRRRHARRVEVVACDVSEQDSRAALIAAVDELGLKVDVLVLCAGFGMGGPFVDEDPDRIQLMLRTNFEGTVTLARTWAPEMAERGRGAILVVSSIAGNQPMPHFGAYAATKAGVTSFGEMLHEELRRSGVTVTVLCPGEVTTEFADVAEMTAVEKRVPRALKITAEDCARAGLEALERGDRKVVPAPAVKALHFVGGHAPRGLWLRVCKRLMG